MKIAAIALLTIGMSIAAFPSFAVDNSISSLCRADQAGAGHQRPGGFCDAVKGYGNSAAGDGVKLACPYGEETNPSPPPACLPI